MTYAGSWGRQEAINETVMSEFFNEDPETMEPKDPGQANAPLVWDSEELSWNVVPFESASAILLMMAMSAGTTVSTT